MKKFAVTSVAALAITGLGVAPATAQSTGSATSTTTTTDVANRTSADSQRRKRCVTKREFRRVKVRRHQRMRRVHRIFDIRGKQTYVYTIGGIRYVGREYRACRHPRWSMVSVDYKRGRVTGKFAYWG